MNATQKTFLGSMFGWAEHEVEDNIKKFTDAVGHVISGDTPTAVAGPSQSDFNALKAELETLRSRFDDLVPETSSAATSGSTDSSAISTGTQA